MHSASLIPVKTNIALISTAYFYPETIPSSFQLNSTMRDKNTFDLCHNIQTALYRKKVNYCLFLFILHIYGHSDPFVIFLTDIDQQSQEHFLFSLQIRLDNSSLLPENPQSLTKYCFHNTQTQTSCQSAKWKSLM